MQPENQLEDYNWHLIDANTPKNMPVFLGGKDMDGEDCINIGFWNEYSSNPDGETFKAEWDWGMWFQPKYWMPIKELPK